MSPLYRVVFVIAGRGGRVTAALNELRGLDLSRHCIFLDFDGASGQIAAMAQDGLHVVPGAGYDMRTFDRTQQEHEGYYLGYANAVLWPLCHRRADLMALHAGDFDAFMGVNRRLARMMAKHCRRTIRSGFTRITFCRWRPACGPKG